MSWRANRENVASARRVYYTAPFSILNFLANYIKEKKRLSLIVRVNVVLNRTVVVDSD